MFLEIFGVITGIVYVVLEAKQNKLLWPLGLATSLVYVWIFFSTKFYADMGLQIYYVLISIYGWYLWTRKPNKEADVNSDNYTNNIAVSNIPGSLALLLFFIFLGIWYPIYYILDNYTDSVVPVSDSFTTALAIIATWMLTRKFIEQWYLWIIANIVSVILYAMKGMYPTIILYAIYAGMSFYGYYEWRKYLKADNEK